MHRQNFHYNAGQQTSEQVMEAMKENDAAALAAEMFDHFSSAVTMRQIMGLFRSMCDTIGLRPGPINEFYPKLKAKIKNWKAQALWKKIDARLSHRVYNKGTACSGIRVLVIGAGPCGLRTAIEAQLLGAKVVVLEKRDRITRNNVLHLWPFLIHDLRALGAKKFYGKFCAGSIDHISIRQLQCLMLKISLLLGIEIHEGVSFEGLVEPSEGLGWRCMAMPSDHPVTHFEFDCLLGADGKRNTLSGFGRKEFRGKLAIAITANFINRRTEEEARIEEISGVAFIFNQSFFKELYHQTGIDLENIVYYKDDTHYFVMTAKKHSLLDKGVIIQDFSDPAELLHPNNVNTQKLQDYAREAADFSTKYQMPTFEFAVNHYGKPDVAMFDFTSMFAAENSSRMIVRKNYRLLMGIVGDSLLEPFWPSGSGCARGFLSAMDAAYAIKLFANSNNSLLSVLSQRESIYRLLAQTTPENLHRDHGGYTLDPMTRYPNLNRQFVLPHQVKHLLDTDDPSLLELTFMDTNTIQSLPEPPVKTRKRRTADTTPMANVLLAWIRSHLKDQEFISEIVEPSQIFTNGKVLCALIHRYRPDLCDWNAIENALPEESNEIAFGIFEKEFKIPPVMSADESITLQDVDIKTWLHYLEQICEVFRGEIPHVKHPKLDYAEFKQKTQTQKTNNMSDFTKLHRIAAAKREAANDENGAKKSRDKLPVSPTPPTVEHRRGRKRRSYEKYGGNIDREKGIPSALPRSGNILDDPFSNRIRNIEEKFTTKNAAATNKKPKDLLRAIGKIESNDWNVKEIEKKMLMSKKITDIGKSREKVPKWNREQFEARQNKMQKPDCQDASEIKYKEIDETIKALDKQLKEGSALDRGERGKNKVASIAASTFGKKKGEENQQPAKNSGLILSSQGVSESCHFCKQRVYLMEKINAEGLVLHRSCLKCHHCHTNLRLGGYAFDRENPDGKFYCTQHFKLPPKDSKFVPKRLQHKQRQADYAAFKAQQQKHRNSEERATGDDLDNRGKTPERIEFENADERSYCEEEADQIMDENEWTDLNFGTGDEDSVDDESSSDETDTESDSDNFEDPVGVDAQTLQLASDWIDKRSTMQDSEDEFYGYSSEDDDADSQTEGEELAKAREMRMNEVKLQPPPTYILTDTETEAQSDTESDEVLNSATEISTDSEFDQDPINHEPPKIFINDSHVRHRHPARVHVKQTRTETMKNTENSRTNGKHDQNVHLKFKPLVEVDPSIVRREPLKNPLPGNYLLSKTASTEGIASKKSLELKKRYLLGGDTGSNAVLKSDSASALDMKFKSFASNISECQKKLNPATEISPSMQTFLQRIDRNNELNKSQHSFGISKELKDKYNNNNNNNNSIDQEEKENCPLDLNKKQEVTIETVNTTLIETKIREMSPEVPKLPEIEIIETIDLTTPEKKQPIVDLDNVEIPQNTIDDNKQFIENMEKSTSVQETNLKIKSKLDSMFIDLTVDSPPKENHINGTANKEQIYNNNIISSVPDIISNISTKLNGASKDEESIERPRSPAHETTIEVPQMWTKPVDTAKDIDTDSLSNNSSTSSLEDIPHFILDSTTSPETQNENANFQNQPPRLEVRDSSGELMQIDSLMIIDGQYIGDPEDLPLFEDQQPTATMPERAENSSMEGSISSTKPLKFDTKNENKLESLKHLPLIVAHEDIPNESHVQLRFSDKISPIQTPEDGDKTPLAGAVPLAHISDSENEITGQGLTETELSDWAADDAVSENFMDIEFVLNSGKGTMKRNKKLRSLKSESERLKSRSPKKTNKGDSECGILKNLAIEEIDFMDTGSEAESIETHSASNRVVLKNHGYVKFVDHQYNGSINRSGYNAYENDKNKAKEKSPPPPVVEAINMEIVNVDFIEQGAYILNNNHDNCNINEQKTPVNEDDGGKLLDSLNASCDDIDEDSLIAIDDKNQESLPTTTITTTETEDLTIVTSPLESLPKYMVEPTTPTNNTTTISSTVISSTSTPSDKYEEYERARFERNSAERASSTSRMSREHIEEMGGYEEYVKSLQMKIAQISSGRESLEKKTRRKLSKSDLLGSTELPDDFSNKPLDNKSIFGTLMQVEAPQTLSKKLEELTKERTKQKDIIHDLVMNKLQAKKQLNAEKRLNRSKNRTNFMSSMNQPNAEQQDTNVLTEITPNKEPINNSNSHVINYNERKNNDYPAFDSFKSQSAHSSPTKVTKAQSFNYYRHRSIERNVDDAENFRTPAPPPRNRLYSDLMNNAEKMREDARARAKLKSNEDLGLSPEEKILMLRKKYNLMQNDNYVRGQNMPSIFANGRNQSDDMKYREKKLSVSKSFNDISLINRLSKDYPASTFQKPITDCMSDPNLADASIKDSTKDVSTSTKTNKSHRRDSDRRRSLIQTVSDFFHKKRDQSASNKDLTSTPSTASKDKLSENSSSTMSVFSRFKLSPKSKESSKDKAKSCCDLRKMGINEKESTPPYTNERSRSVASLKQPVLTAVEIDDQAPPIPPLPKNYQRSDDEEFPDLNGTKNELKKLRAMSKASKQAELKRLRIAQEIKREQDEIDLKIKDLETRGVEIEKFLRGEGQNTEQLNESSHSQVGATDEELLKELLDIWRSITQMKKRDEELIIRQQELQLEHRHAQLKEELSIRLSCSKLDKSAQDVAAEGAILSEMLEIVSKRAALRPTEYPSTSLNSENISLPVLPPQTTINPLLQHQYSQQPTPANTSNRYQPIASNQSNVVHHTFSSQSHNQEHDI
ncbi:hypothetical protein ACKWTF_010045 [Chironomus riparius]